MNAARTLGVKGLVTDEKGNPVSGVVVRVRGRHKMVKVSEQGEYWILLLPGEYHVRVEKLKRSPRDRKNLLPALTDFQVIKIEPGKVTRHDFTTHMKH